MYDHIGLHVKNLAASIAFYQAALAPFGYEVCSRDETSAGLGRPSEPALWLYAARTSSTAHVAFRAANRATVDRFHQRGVEAGGPGQGKPRPAAHPPPPQHPPV